MTEGYYNKLKGRIYGLLCEKEKEGSWEKFLDTIITCGEIICSTLSEL